MSKKEARQATRERGPGASNQLVTFKTSDAMVAKLKSMAMEGQSHHQVAKLIVINYLSSKGTEDV